MSEYGPTHNAEASKPLADWRDAEIERLRNEAVRWEVTCKKSQDQTIKVLAVRAKLRRELAEARELLLLVRDKGFAYWRNHELARRLNAFLAAQEGEL
jgi:hypothetical protein